MKNRKIFISASIVLSLLYSQLALATTTLLCEDDALPRIPETFVISDDWKTATWNSSRALDETSVILSCTGSESSHVSFVCMADKFTNEFGTIKHEFSENGKRLDLVLFLKGKYIGVVSTYKCNITSSLS